MNEKIRFFVKTTNINYTKNLIISFPMSMLFSYILYLKSNKIVIFLSSLFIFFILLFRIIEYLLTHKSIRAGLVLFGRVEEDNDARHDFYVYVVYLAIVIFFAAGVII